MSSALAGPMRLAVRNSPQSAIGLSAATLRSTLPALCTRPDDLTDGQIVAELAAGWGFQADACAYLPVGFGRHQGEPDARNVLKAPADFVIVDWDFAQLAPPERDLWHLAETDDSVLAAYRCRRRASQPVGRVLCARLRGPAAIHLGLPLPAASCGLPASIGRAALKRSRRTLAHWRGSLS
jgi:hypothetical protein